MSNLKILNRIIFLFYLAVKIPIEVSPIQEVIMKHACK